MAIQAVNGQAQEPTARIELNQFHLNVVLGALRKRPFEEVVETFGLIMQQLQPQQPQGPQSGAPQAPAAL